MITGKWIINIKHKELKGSKKGVSHSIFYYNGDLTDSAILAAWKKKFSFGGGVEGRYQPISTTVSFHKDPTVTVAQFSH